MVPALWLSRDHPSNYWIAVDSDLLMRDHKRDVELRADDRWYLRYRETLTARAIACAACTTPESGYGRAFWRQGFRINFLTLACGSP
jgi:hypothetical protein